MIIPAFFEKELHTIDQTYRVEETDDHDGFFVIKDVDLSLKADGGKTLSIRDPKMLRVRGPLIVLWVPALDSRALDKLREMKLRALELGIYDNPVNELAYYKSLQKKAREARRDLAVDMISEGLMEAHKLERSRSWSYGGEKPKEK